MHTDRRAGQRVFRVEWFLVFPDAFRGQVFFEEGQTCARGTIPA